MISMVFFPAFELQNPPHGQILERSAALPFMLVIFGTIWK